MTTRLLVLRSPRMFVHRPGDQDILLVLMQGRLNAGRYAIPLINIVRSPHTQQHAEPAPVPNPGAAAKVPDDQPWAGYSGLWPALSVYRLLLQ